ncbi:MAG TPA: hypothetical protein VG365_08365 [Solirubrobacteraceae bacterium]|nr:hypothetical protein [Solirubrobacteraceae bacterium]
MITVDAKNWRWARDDGWELTVTYGQVAFSTVGIGAGQMSLDHRHLAPSGATAL